MYPTYIWSYRMKYEYFMTERVVQAIRGLCFPQLDTKFTTKQQGLAKIGAIVWFWKSSPI